MNANDVLPELSAKSLEGPLSEVANESSSSLAAISSITLIPSPNVLPGAVPAEIVADL